MTFLARDAAYSIPANITWGNFVWLHQTPGRGMGDSCLFVGGVRSDLPLRVLHVMKGPQEMAALFDAGEDAGQKPFTGT